MLNPPDCLAFGLGGQDLMILALVVLVLFGGTKIPQLMRGLGEGVREFRKSTDGSSEGPISPAKAAVPPSS